MSHVEMALIAISIATLSLKRSSIVSKTIRHWLPMVRSIVIGVEPLPATAA